MESFADAECSSGSSLKSSFSCRTRKGDALGQLPCKATLEESQMCPAFGFPQWEPLLTFSFFLKKRTLVLGNTHTLLPGEGWRSSKFCFCSVVQSKNILYQFQHCCLLDAKHVGLGFSSVGFRFETEALSIEKVKPGASFPPVQTWWRRFHHNMPKCSPVTCFPVERVESAMNPNSISNEMRKVASAIITQLLRRQPSSSMFLGGGWGGLPGFIFPSDGCFYCPLHPDVAISVGNTASFRARCRSYEAGCTHVAFLHWSSASYI